MVPTLIRDGSVGSGGNLCQKGTSCQQLQGWGHLARHAINLHLDQKQKNDGNSPVLMLPDRY